MVSPAQRAIALLIDMAEQGEIDPWDVQVVEVIDRFLQDLDYTTLALDSSQYEANLSESAQAFLYASMLVLLKADTLAQMADQDWGPLGGEDDFLPEVPDNVIPLPTAGLPTHLERHLRRRAIAQPPSQRPVTLPELIEQLELMGEAMERQIPRPKSRQPKPPSDRQASRAINQLSHQENPAALADGIGQFLENHWLRLVGEGDWLSFEDLMEAWQQQMAGNPQFGREDPDRVGVFWALLLLTAQSKVELQQDSLYGPLYIQLLAPGTLLAFPPTTDPDSSFVTIAEARLP